MIWKMSILAIKQELTEQREWTTRTKMAFHKAPKECNVRRSNPLACQVPRLIMRRGLGPLIWMVVSFTCIYVAFWPEGDRQTGYIY